MLINFLSVMPKYPRDLIANRIARLPGNIRHALLKPMNAMMAEINNGHIPKTIIELLNRVDVVSPEELLGISIHDSEEWHIMLTYLLALIKSMALAARSDLPHLPDGGSIISSHESKADWAINCGINDLLAAWRAVGFTSIGRPKLCELAEAVFGPLMPEKIAARKYEYAARKALKSPVKINALARGAESGTFAPAMPD